MNRELDKQVAEKIGFELTANPHDRSGGKYEVSQCAACGDLWETTRKKCGSCKSENLGRCINPRIPAFSWHLPDAMIALEAISTDLKVGYAIAVVGQKVSVSIIKHDDENADPALILASEDVPFNDGRKLSLALSLAIAQAIVATPKPEEKKSFFASLWGTLGKK